MSSYLLVSLQFILNAIEKKAKPRKIIVPVQDEYAVVAHPIMPKMSPAANINQTITLFVFSAISLTSFYIKAKSTPRISVVNRIMPILANSA